MIPGTELDALRRDGKTYAHVLALGVESDPGAPGCRLPRARRRPSPGCVPTAGVPFLAHPYWSGLRTDEFEEIEGLAGLEVFNVGCELEVGRGHAGLHWDEALESRARPPRHRHRRLPPPRQGRAQAWVWARCERNAPEAVLAALDSGAFYGSTRPGDRGARDRGRRRRRPLQPARSITLLTGRTKGREVNAGEGAYIYSGEVLGTDGGRA